MKSRFAFCLEKNFSCASPCMFSSKVISLWKGRETGSTFHFSKCHFRILKAERFDLVVSGLRPATSALRPPILLGRICSGPIANLAHKSPPKIRGGGERKGKGGATPTDRRAELLAPPSTKPWSYAYFLVRHCHLPPVLHHAAAAPNYCGRVAATDRS